MGNESDVAKKKNNQEIRKLSINRKMDSCLEFIRMLELEKIG